jgi:hypothetical protein
MAATSDFSVLHRLWLGHMLRAACLANGVGQGKKIVLCGSLLGEDRRKAHDLPTTWCCQPLRVHLAQVVTVRLSHVRKRSKDCRRIRVHVGERCHGGTRTGCSGALAH